MGNFKKWIDKNAKIMSEMSLVGFGTHKGKDHTELPNSYINWMREQIARGNTNFAFTDEGKKVVDQRDVDEILSQEQERRKSPYKMIPKPPASSSRGIIQTQTPAGGSNIYYLATSKGIKDVPNGDPIVVFTDKDARWTGLWKYQDRKGKTGNIQTPFSKVYNIEELETKIGMIKRVIEPDGSSIKGIVPEDLFDRFDKMRPDGSVKDPNGSFEDEVGDQIKKSERSPGSRPSNDEVRIPSKNMTEYNRKIENNFVNSQENIMIDALAGTGKTTMLKHLSSFIKPGEKWLYLVFNKKNQIESSHAFPNGVDVQTTHSFLGKILKASGKELGGDMQLPTKGEKWRKIHKVADSIMAEDWPNSNLNYRNNRTGNWQSPFHWKAKSITTKLADLAKAYAIRPDDPQVQNKLKEILLNHGIDTDVATERGPQWRWNRMDRDYTPDIIEMCVKLLQLTMPHGLSKDDKMYNFRDQDDTLWFAALNADSLRWNPDKYNVVLMDEVQDFNECQLIMARKLKEAGCRVIGVGDPNQAMYGFRGANSQAFGKLKEIIGSGQSQSLPINFRSGGNIIDWVKQNTHVKTLQAAPHLAGMGEVYADGGTHPPQKYQQFIDNVTSEFENNKGNTDQATAIISRTNAPLGHTALHFLKNNVDFQIIGKDLSRDLVDLIRKTTINKPENYDIEDFPNLLRNYIAKLEELWANKIAKAEELKELNEFADVMLAVINFLEEKDYKENEKSRPLENVKDFQSYLERKLGGLDPDNPNDAAKIKSQDPRKVVTLTTAHKAKGLEWDRVFLMRPSEYDPNKPNIKTQEQAQQERNAWYVAATRGRKTLMVSDDDGPN